MAIKLYNDHARAVVLGAVWSPPDSQLVAVQMAASSAELIKALKAELEKNNRNAHVWLEGEGVKECLSGARRGYVSLNASLEKVNAQGHTTVLLHWRAGDPRAIGKGDEPFYVVATADEPLCAKFVQRLQLASALPLKPEWAEPLITLGREAGLVESLPVAGQGFQSALRVVKDDARWGDLIGEALQTGVIAL